MPDYSDRYTDKKISEVDRVLKRTYRTAQTELKKKLADFNKRFNEKSRKKKQQVKDGEITEQEYKDWLTGQVFIRNQWQSQINAVNSVLLDHNKQAIKIINNGTLDVFAESYNFNAFRAESMIAASFTVYNAESVARLILGDPQLLPEWKINEKKDYAWNYDKVNNIVRQAIIQGKGIEEITGELCSRLSTTNESKMRMFARTALGSAQNAGRQKQMEDAAALGIEVNKQWEAAHDSKTRDSHRALDGEEVPYDEEFSNGLMFPKDPTGAPEEVYNCFVGDTIVTTNSDIVRSYKHEYTGKLFTIKTACGVQFTCTPNHPILTDRGWIHAESLNNGDHLIIASIVKTNPARVYPDIDHAFSSIEAVHKFMNEFFGERTTRLGVNFHGDISTTDVEIVTQKRFLRNNGDTCGRNRINKFLLKHSDESLVSNGSLVKHFRRVRFSTFGNVRRRCKPLAFFRRSVCHPYVHGIGTITDFDSILIKATNDGVPCDIEFFGKCFDGLPGRVFFDDVISIDVSSADHIAVYNLQTQNGYYFVNNNITEIDGKYNGNFVIAHNCRCTMKTIYPKYEDRTKPDWREEEVIDGESYHEWKKFDNYAEWKKWKEETGQVKTSNEPNNYATNRQIVEQLEKDGFVMAGLGSTLEGIDTECSQMIYDCYKRTFERFPFLESWDFENITAHSLEEGVYADCDPDNGRIRVGLAAFKDMGILKAYYDKDVKEGYHPKGTNVEAVIFHEIGHRIDAILQNENGFADRYSKAMFEQCLNKGGTRPWRTFEKHEAYSQIGLYAGKDEEEWFAECFATYMTAKEEDMSEMQKAWNSLFESAIRRLS